MSTAPLDAEQGGYAEMNVQQDVQSAKDKYLKVYTEREKKKHTLERWQKKVAGLESEMQHLIKEEKALKDTLHHLTGQVPAVKDGELLLAEDATNDQDDDLALDKPPGPRSLYWVEGQVFSLTSMLVVFMNIIVMSCEKIWKPYAKITEELWWADQAFLLFYCVELGLKAVLWREKFLCGSITRIWANWLDVVIVGASFLEQVILPLCHLQVAGGNLSILRGFRLFRFARIFRICGNLRKSIKGLDENEWFTMFIMGVICVNCITMGVQIDYPDLGVWIYFENLFLVIFVFEIIVRLNHWGSFFFYNQNWCFNNLDFLIVAGGVADQWLLPTASLISIETGGHAIHASSLGNAVNILRMLRLIRLLRLVRLMRSITPLYQLLMGIIDAMQGMMWLLLLTIAVIYVIALVCIKLWGRGGLRLHEHEPHDVLDVFPNTRITMWILFMAMNGDPSGMQPLFDTHPETLLFAAAYMVFSSFAILSVLTGVVADKMATAAEENQTEHDSLESAQKEDKARELMEKIFEDATKGKEQFMTKEEFESATADEDMMLELAEATGFEQDEIQDSFGSLCKDVRETAAGPIPSASKDDFMNGLLGGKSTANELSIHRIEKHLADIKRQLAKKS